MKNVVIIALSVLLAGSIIFGLILYGRYSESQTALLASEKETRALGDRIAQLEQKSASLQEEIGKLADQFAALQKAKHRIAELEAALVAKERELSKFGENLRQIETGYKEEKRIKDEIGAELLSKDTSLTELKEELKTCESHTLSLEEETSKSQEHLGQLQSQLSELEKQKNLVETQLNHVTDSSKAAIAELKRGVQDKDSVISECREHLEQAHLQILSLREEIERENRKFQRMESQVSVLEKEKNSAETRLSQTTVSHKAIIDGLQKEIQDRDATIAELRGELKHADTKLSSFQEQVVAGQREVKVLQAKLSELSGEKAQIENKIDHLETSYESLLSDLKKQIENRDVTIQRIQEKLSITLVDHILFEFGKATISPEGKENLRKVAKILRGIQNKMIEVVGHTDEIPIMEKYQWKFPSNWELSADRAAAVVRYLQELGVEPADMEAVGRSFYAPIGGNETAEGRAKNRRVNIIIAPKLVSDLGK
jgi:chemotaxis protein MotB